MNHADTTNGALYLIATPIGNLEDITLRAIRILKEVDIIACEDTRVSSHLLKSHDIHKPLISYFEYNEKQRSNRLVEILGSGKRVALISKAGTPLISDPGYELVKLCIANNIRVTVVPGACALTAALSASGLPADRFIFEGFLPRKPSKRKRRLQEIAQGGTTAIVYESPYRIHKTILELKEFTGPDRQVVLAREMTKLYEELKRGSIREIIERLSNKPVKGEITLIIGPL